MSQQGSSPVGQHTNPDFSPLATSELSSALNALLADYFALFVKTKGFHWHVPGPNFREHHALLEEHAAAVAAAIDPLAERIRKLGRTTVTSIGDIACRQRIVDCNDAALQAVQIFEILSDDNQQLLTCLRESHGLCDAYGDTATSALLDDWIDQAEERLWHLFEACRPLEPSSATTRKPKA
jgi:starvation-inducible DNA-binding protein